MHLLQSKHISLSGLLMELANQLDSLCHKEQQPGFKGVVSPCRQFSRLSLSHFDFLNISSETFFYFHRLAWKGPTSGKQFLMFTEQHRVRSFGFQNLQCS